MLILDFTELLINCGVHMHSQHLKRLHIKSAYENIKYYKKSLKNYTSGMDDKQKSAVAFKKYLKFFFKKIGCRMLKSVA